MAAEEDCATALTTEVEQAAMNVIQCEEVSLATSSSGSASPKAKHKRLKRKTYPYTVSVVKETEAHEAVCMYKEVFWTEQNSYKELSFQTDPD